MSEVTTTSKVIGLIANAVTSISGLDVEIGNTFFGNNDSIRINDDIVALKYQQRKSIKAIIYYKNIKITELGKAILQGNKDIAISVLSNAFAEIARLTVQEDAITYGIKAFGELRTHTLKNITITTASTEVPDVCSVTIKHSNKTIAIIPFIRGSENKVEQGQVIEVITELLVGDLLNSDIKNLLG